MPTALLSVSNKLGIVEFALLLIESGYSLIASGGTRLVLQQHSIDSIEVSDLTKFPEIMDGRVKTLHPQIHGGILARRDRDQQCLDEYNIRLIDLVVVNLYPFAETVSKHCQDHDIGIENIDIGGPTLIRSAAKNYRWVTVVTNPDDYQWIGDQLKKQKLITLEQRYKLATKAFATTAHYDRIINSWFEQNKVSEEKPLPTQIELVSCKKKQLRYGENPHQLAAMYLFKNGGWNAMQQYHGKSLSYNNIVDSELAFRCVNEFSSPACVIVKHANPCAAACDDNIICAYHAAFAADCESAFGGIVAFNRRIGTKEISEIINNQFVEVILAPEISKDAESVLVNKPDVRLITLPILEEKNLHIRSIAGGVLVQKNIMPESNFTHVAGPAPQAQHTADINNAWKIVKHVKSNAIVLYKNGQTLGIGAGQTSRVQSLKIAVERAKGKDLSNAVIASDAFLPFADSVEYAAQVGIHYIIQTGGSIRDDSVINAANRHNITMLFTGIRYFSH